MLNHKRLQIWHAYFTYEALSNNTKVDGLLTLSMPFMIKKTFSYLVATGCIVF